MDNTQLKARVRKGSNTTLKVLISKFGTPSIPVEVLPKEFIIDVISKSLIWEHKLAEAVSFTHCVTDSLFKKELMFSVRLGTFS